MVLQIVTLNVRGIVDTVKRRSILNYYSDRANILCFQETHSTKEDEQIWKSEWHGTTIFSHGTSSARGVSIYLKDSLGYRLTQVERDEDGRFIVIELENTDDPQKRIVLCNLYAPNKDKPLFFHQLIKSMVNMSSNIIMVGDYNLVLDTNLDRHGSSYNNKKAQMVLEQIMQELSLIDVWRVRNPNTREYSWMKAKPQYSASRIDFGLISQGLSSNCVNVMYLPGIKTDHRAFYLAVDQIFADRGRGYWKLNNLLLQKPEFYEHMNQVIDSKRACSISMQPIERWIYIKTHMIDAAKLFSKENASSNAIAISQLSEKILEMERGLFNDPQPAQNQLNLLEKSKMDMDDLISEKTKGALFRTKSRWHEFGEKNSKYFFNLEKSRYNARTCTKLVKSDGNEETDPGKIRQIQYDFYSGLYKKDPSVTFDITNDTGISVPEDMRMTHDQPFTIIELKNAVKQMHQNKTPGITGLTADFYKAFLCKFEDILFDAITSMYKQGNIPGQLKLAVINLIPKANKDTRFLKSMRPISILENDYKIIEKLIANRLEQTLDHILHVDQKGFRKNYRMTSNIRKAFDIIQFADKNKLDSIILQLDFEKCFDKVDHGALIGALKFFNFSTYLVNWTELLYEDCKAVIQNNGYFGPKIKLEQGIRQGGPASSLYFLICAEILAINLRSNDIIKGIPVEDIENLLGQFADDMDMYLMCEECSLEQVFQTLERFKALSGFTVNYDKTLIYRIGSLKNSQASLYTNKTVVWTNGPIKVLGVYVDHDINECIRLNYNSTIIKVEAILKRWSARSLSLMGKITIINSLVASLFVHKMTVLPFMPDKMLKHLESKMEHFLWNGRKPKITLNQLQASKSTGGLQLVSLRNKDLSLKAAWVRNLQMETQLAMLAYNVMGCDIKENLWTCNLRTADVEQIISKKESPFWHDVLYAWTLVDDTLVNRDKSFLWCNSDIRINDRPLMWRNAYKKGLKRIQDLYQNGNLLSVKIVADRYGLTVMEFNGLISAVPVYIRNMAKQERPTDLAPTHTPALTSRKIYQFLTSQENVLGPKVDKWKAELNREIDNATFLQNCKNIYKVTNIPRYRSFQYRLLSRAIITNVHLKHWNLLQTNDCSFCNKEKESYLHLFVYCEKVQPLWIEVEQFINIYSKDQINFNEYTVINNLFIEKKPGHVKNLVCLIVKQYIYRQRCLHKQLNFRELKAHIVNIENSEKYIAIKNSRLYKHWQKWRPDSIQSLSHQIADQMIREYIDNM